MHTATLFDDSGHQAVRLPKDVQFEGVAEVEVKREGRSVVLTPKSNAAARLESKQQNLAQMLAMPGIGGIDFEPARLEGPLCHPAEFHDVSD